MKELRIGSEVFSKEGKKAGELYRVVLDPETMEVTDLIVRKGLLMKKDRVVPVSLVDHLDEAGNVHLKIGLEELAQCREYREIEFTVPVKRDLVPAPYAQGGALYWQTYYQSLPREDYVLMTRERVKEGVPQDHPVLRRGLPIFLKDGRKLGVLDHLVVERETGRIAYLAVRKGLLLRHSRLIPVEIIDSMDDEGIYLNATLEEVQAMRHYKERDDEAIRRAVERRLNEAEAFDFSGVTVEAQNGEITLRGNVATIAAKRHAERLARGVQGVVGVRNALTSDTELTARIVTALAQDERTSLLSIEVAVDRGIVTLRGEVPTAEHREAAEAIARAVPGVVTVVNELKVVPEDRFPTPPLYTTLMMRQS